VERDIRGEIPLTPFGYAQDRLRRYAAAALSPKGRRDLLPRPARERVRVGVV